MGGPVPASELNPNAHSHVQRVGGLDVSGPDTAAGAAVDPSKHRLVHRNWCHFVPDLGRTSSKH